MVKNIDGQIPLNDQTWQNVFTDEFNGILVNPLEWESQWPWLQNTTSKTGGINSGCTPMIVQTQNYSYRTPNFANCQVSNGTVKIISKQEYYPHALCWDRWINSYCYGAYQLCPVDTFVDFNYTTGMLLSKNFYRYGYFEIMCKIPMPQSPHQTQALGPNFWLWNANCGYTASSEIDVFEICGEYNDIVNFHTTNLHFQKCNPELVNTCTESTSEFHHEYYDALGSINFNSFHKFAVEWGADRVVYYFDDNIYYISEHSQYADEFCPMRIILDINTPATGFCYTGPTSYTHFPYIYEIAYMKVWQLKQLCNTDITLCSFNPSSYEYALYRNITLGGTNCTPTIAAGNNITLRATDGILLDKGFTVEVGAIFLAETAPCQQQEKYKN